MKINIQFIQYKFILTWCKTKNVKHVKSAQM